MYRLIKPLLVSLTLTASVGAAAAGGQKQLQDYLDDIKALQAQFEQTLLDENGTVLEVSSGSVYLEKPNKFRWDYKKPYDQSIVGDGSRIWVYDRDLEQVTVKPMENALANTPAALLGGEADVEDEFDVSELGEKDNLRWLMLKAKASDNQFNAVRLGFEGPNIRIMELTDNLGQLTQIRFSAERRNHKIAPSIFQFTPPAGVDVIDAADQI